MTWQWSVNNFSFFELWLKRIIEVLQLLEKSAFKNENLAVFDITLR